MLEVVSVTSYSDQPEDLEQTVSGDALTARRGGFLHGTKVATTSGWKPVELIATGDLVRTLDHGFKEVRRVSTDPVVIPAGETRAEYLPILVPSRAAYNGRPVWLMPEQGVALDHGKIDPDAAGLSVVAARLFSGACRLTSQAPETSFDVSTLFFDRDEVIFIEGGLQAYCPAGRFSMRGAPGKTTYRVADEDDAEVLINSIANRGDLSALANPLGALPAPIPQEPIFPIRPPLGIRRPGRPGRPDTPMLFLRPEWQT